MAISWTLNASLETGFSETIQQGKWPALLETARCRRQRRLLQSRALTIVGMALQRHVDFNFFPLSFTFHGSRAVQNAAPDSSHTQEQKAVPALRSRKSLPLYFAFLDLLAYKQRQFPARQWHFYSSAQSAMSRPA